MAQFRNRTIFWILVNVCHDKHHHLTRARPDFVSVSICSSVRSIRLPFHPLTSSSSVVPGLMAEACRSATQGIVHSSPQIASVPENHSDESLVVICELKLLQFCSFHGKQHWSTNQPNPRNEQMIQDSDRDCEAD
jgi:hypothetical protein